MTIAESFSLHGHGRHHGGMGAGVVWLLALQDRWDVLDRLRWQLNGPDQPVDLLIVSQSQLRQRLPHGSSVVVQAYREGVGLDG